MKKFILASFTLLLSSLSFAETQVVPKFIYVLHGGVDAVWGQYMFMVKNSSDQTINSKVKVTLPKETVDWQAQEGLGGIDFNLGENGGVEFSKDFNPGDNVHTVGFKVPARSGDGEISIDLPMDVKELSFLTTGSIIIEGENMKVEKRQGQQKYDKYHFLDLKAGDTVTIKVAGVHVGRTNFWMYGWIAAAIIFLAAFGLAYTNRPKLNSEAI